MKIYIISFLIIFGSLVITVLNDQAINKIRIKNWHSYLARLFFSLFYLIAAVTIVYYLRDKMFYLDKKGNFDDLFRFAWCVSSSFVGFALIASQSRFSEKLPYGPYLFYYPVLLLMISSLVFSLVSIFDVTSNYIFYFLSFPLCFILSFLTDSFWDMVIKFINNKGV